ncbi:MAG: thymidylate kinase [Ruminococcaceae bacterium]|nr:thymidylate kinase [Oscillospiraceae bacterium]
MGKLIVIEGVDASGKQTQTDLLLKSLKSDGLKVRTVSFPDYESDFSLPVRRYLAGDLGNDPKAVNAYAASTFYAIDRYASFVRDWGEFYKEGGIIIADRYVTSNIVHQASKVEKDEKEDFIKWLSELEYEKLGLPVPDGVIFLDMPPAFARELMRERMNKITGDAQKDIHERDTDYLETSYNNAVSIARLLKWNKVSCIKDEKVRTREEIAHEIYEKVKIIIENE